MADPELAQAIAIYQSGLTGNYIASGATALYAFEWLLTFDREVELFWRRKVTVSSILFLVNRYVPFIVIFIFAPWQTPPTTPTTDEPLARCAAAYYAGETLEIFQYVPWAVFSALRSYVLSSKTWPLAALVLLLSLAPVAVNYSSMGFTTTEIDPVFGCQVMLKLPVVVYTEIYPIVSRVSLFVSDLLVLVITCYATYRTSKELRALNQKTSLSSILFRDGVLYFAVLTVMNVLHLNFSLLSILDGNIYTSSNSSYLTILTEPVTAILISRFLIDLQEANIQSMRQDSLASVGTLNFNRVVGSASFHLPIPADCAEVGSRELDLIVDAAEVDADAGIVEVVRS